ncbi:MAG: hypothetical protein PHU07_06050 [Acidocella sp.]|nr:hypothetical protein [Acidocella sp.]
MSAAFLTGCAAQGSKVAVAQPDNTAHAAGRSFSLDTPVSKIAADQGGKAVLERDVPGLMSSSSYILLEGMSLAQIAPLSGGRISRTKLDQVQADLAKLAINESTGP